MGRSNFHKICAAGQGGRQRANLGVPPALDRSPTKRIALRTLRSKQQQAAQAARFQLTRAM